MTDHQLPDYLQNRQVQDFTDYADAGLGTMLPPHVSIRANQFTLIDAAGQEYQPMPVMDCVIVDRSTVTCKMFFGKPWVPGSEDPPMCWSTNGVAPSRDAAVPQARTCAECPQNVRGSAVSKLTGSAIKACRDEYHMAILLPSMPTMMFRFVLTPGSFENWQAYTAKFKNTNVKISMVTTRMAFQARENGVVTFESTSFIDKATNDLVQKALLPDSNGQKATDILCGRLDQPRTAALPAPTAVQITQVQQPVPLSTPVAAQQTEMPITPQGSPQLQKNPSITSMTPNTAGPGGTAPVASPSEGQASPRRRRRTAAEMQAAQGQPAVPQPAPAVPGAPQAPFPHPASPSAVPGTISQAAPGSFGMATGQPAAANPELNTMLDDFFGKTQ